MNGPAHYQEAERLLAGKPFSAEDIADGIGPAGGTWAPSEMELRAALVHAVLANAAATAANIRRNGALTRGDYEETALASGWAEVLG